MSDGDHELGALPDGAAVAVGQLADQRVGGIVGAREDGVKSLGGGDPLRGAQGQRPGDAGGSHDLRQGHHPDGL